MRPSQSSDWFFAVLSEEQLWLQPTDRRGIGSHVAGRGRRLSEDNVSPPAIGEDREAGHTL